MTTKKLISILLILCISVSLLSGVSFATSIVDSGTCGDNLTWTLDSAGTLTITGVGAMKNFYDEAPWKWYTVKNVVIEEGVTTIGFGAFLDNNLLTAVSIPSTVTEIGAQAFYGCESLTELIIPNGVTSIKGNAFYNCEALKAVHLPTSLTEFESTAFCSCGSLTRITVDESHTKYSSVDGVLFSKDLTTLIICPGGKSGKYTIPDSVTEIGYGAFWSCFHITKLTIPNSVTKIGSNAFQDCDDLNSINIPDSVTEIPWHAFAYCSSLSAVTIPKSVTIIGEAAFYACDNLRNVYYSGTENQWTAMTISDDNDALDIVTVHYSHSGETETILASGTCGDNLTWKIDDQGTLMISGEGEMEDYENYSDMPWREHYGKFQKLVIEDGVTSIGNNAFWEFGITNVSIPDSVTSIGDDAFFACSLLSSVSIPKSVTEIGSHAFGSCDSLSAFFVDEQNPVFSALDGNLYNKDQTVFLQYAPAKSASSFAVPGHVTEIGTAAFYGCQNLRSVTIPDSVISLGEGAFVGCWALEEIALSSSLTTIESDMFLWCSALSEITIPDNVTTICSSAFYGCDSLAKIIIPASVTIIEDYAFHSDYNYCDVHVYYDGTKADWEKLSSNNDFSCDTNNLLSSYSTIHFVSASLLGDINGDYSVDVLDAVLLFQHSMLPDLYPIEYAGSVDFNKDGAVDVSDAVLLFQYSMLPDLYPIE